MRRNRRGARRIGKKLGKEGIEEEERERDRAVGTDWKEIRKGRNRGRRERERQCCWEGGKTEESKEKLSKKNVGRCK